VPRSGYRIGVPENCFYREILNTDASEFGGSGIVHAPGVPAAPLPWHNQPCSVELTLPPLAVVFLKPESHHDA
jgi:1,4-alpha-glucan branching enzyme